VIEKNKKRSNKNQEPNKKQGFKNISIENGQKTQSTHATYSGFVVVHTFHVQFRVQYPLVSL